MPEQEGITESTCSPRVEFSPSDPCGEEGFENGDQDAGYPAASQILGTRKDPKTSPSMLFPGTRRLCRFRRGRRRLWPSCMAEAAPFALRSKSRRIFSASAFLPVGCKGVCQRHGGARRTIIAQWPAGTRRSLPEACPCLRSRCRECSVETNPLGPAAALSYLLQSGGIIP